jgi:uncharacterized protein (DUF2235 family)
MGLYAFDGTNQDDSDTGTDWTAVAADTNIFRFYSAYEGYASASPDVQSDYVPGVGTRFGIFGEAFGGAFGFGWLDRIEETYAALCAAYPADPVIDIIGFSRGAAIALDFANRVCERGIEQSGVVIDAHPRIRFLGLFDAVSAYAVANLGGPFADIDLIHDFDLPSCVEHCYHAMALDERRPSFVNRRVPGAYEVWFRGAHSDIGGGNDNPALEYVALRWMFRKAIACGLPITEANITDSAVHPETPIRPNQFSAISTFWRTIGDNDLIHYAVSQHPPLPGEQLNALPAAHFVESVEDETTRVDAPFQPLA